MSEPVSAGVRRPSFFSTHIVNPGVYLEGLVHLWVPGLAVGIPAAILSAVTTVEATPYTSGGLMLLQVLLTLILPLLFLSAFSFLSSRREADLRLSAPVTRTCLYLSFCLAALTVCLLVMIVTTLCILLPGSGRTLPMAYLLGQVNALENIPMTYLRAAALDAFFRSMLYDLCCGFMLCGVMAVAVTLSGRAGHAVLLYVLLIAVPEQAMQVLTDLMKKLPMMPYSTADSLSALPVRRMLIMSFSTLGTRLPGAGAYAAALLLGVLFFAVGGLLFRRRKAETAGSPADGRGVLRMTVCLLVLLPVLMMAGDHIVTDAVLWLTAAAVVSYCVYLLLVTRKASSLLKYLPRAAVTAAVTLTLLYGGFRAAGAVRVRIPLEADRVEGVSVQINDPSAGFSFSDTHTFRYCSRLPSDLLEMREQALINKAVSLTEKDRQSRLNLHNARRTGLADAAAEITFTFRLKSGLTRSYEVSVTTEDKARFAAAYSEASERLYRELLISLPERRASSAAILLLTDTADQPSVNMIPLVSVSDRRRLEQAFRDELAALDEDGQRRAVLPVDVNREAAVNNVFMGNPVPYTMTEEQCCVCLLLHYTDKNGFNADMYYRITPGTFPEFCRVLRGILPEADEYLNRKEAD